MTRTWTEAEMRRLRASARRKVSAEDNERGAGRRALRDRRRGEWRADYVRSDGHDVGDQPAQAGAVRPETQKPALGKTQASEGSMTVLIYVNTSKQVGESRSCQGVRKRGRRRNMVRGE